jgi:hypothetical protein
MFAELRQALEVQQGAIADRLEAVRQAEAALAHLHDVLAMPFLPLTGLTGRVTSGPGLPGTGRPGRRRLRSPCRAAGGIPGGGRGRARVRGPLGSPTGRPHIARP